MIEIWKDIEGYEGIYMVSSLGRVKSLRKCNRINDIILTPINRTGYMEVGLNKNSNKKILRVHRLVASAFLLNPENKPVVNHKNGIKNDNRVDNLEWCTISENVKHSYSIGLSKVKKGKDNHMYGKKGELHHLFGRRGINNPLFGKPSKLRGRINPNSKLVRKVKGKKPNGEYELFLNARDAERKTGTAYQNIYKCCNGERFTAGGYEWAYAD